MKLTSEHIKEIERYFHPKVSIVDKLPDVKSVSDKAEVRIKNKVTDNYDMYQVLEGNWHKTGTTTKV